MNDPKAAAAYHPGDATVTRPDLDAITARVLAGDEIDNLVVQETEQGDWMLTAPAYDDWVVILRTQAAAEFVVHSRDDLLSMRAEIERLRASFAAERARADQAERNVKRYQDRARENRKLLDQYAGQLAKIPHTEDCLIGEWNEAAGHSMPCTCWKSVAPTAEQ